MYATGIIRRMDDLGRVVIPKEIRRTMGIKEGEPLEIYVDHETNSVVFKKHNVTTASEKIESLINSIESNEANKQIMQLLNVAKYLAEMNEKDEG